MQIFDCMGGRGGCQFLLPPCCSRLTVHRRIKDNHQEETGLAGEEKEEHDKSLEEFFNSDMNNERKPVTENLGFEASSNV